MAHLKKKKDEETIWKDMKLIIVKSIYQTTNAVIKIKFTTGIKLLQVSESECHSQGILGQRNTTPTMLGLY